VDQWRVGAVWRARVEPRAERAVSCANVE